MRNSQPDNRNNEPLAFADDRGYANGCKQELPPPSEAETRNQNRTRAPPIIACDVDEIQIMTSLGRTKVYEAISARQLRAKKFGRRTIVLMSDLQAWLEGLPDY